MDISCMLKLNIIRMIKMETILSACGIVSCFLILKISKLKQLMPILIMPYKQQIRVYSSMTTKEIVSRKSWML